MGAILVNINPAYRSHELSYVLRQAGVRLLVSAESFKTSDYRALIGEVRDGLDQLERVIYLGTPEWDRLLGLGATGTAEAGAAHAGAASGPDGSEALQPREAALAFHHPINNHYTTRTTGVPQGAALSHHHIL